MAEICQIDADSDAGKTILAFDAAIKKGATVPELLALAR